MPNEKPPALSPIGEIRGFFETFLPGLFLLFHIALLACCTLPTTSGEKFIRIVSDNVPVLTVIGLPAGYIVGLALRLVRTNPADSLSKWLFPLLPDGRRLLSMAEEWWSNPELPFQLHKPVREERFPYTALMMARIAKHLPSEAREFYETRWANKEPTENEKPKLRVDLFRFGFLKTLTFSVDQNAAKEMYAIEMMVRHAANICYALIFSALALGVAGFQRAPIEAGLQPLMLSLAGGEAFVLIFVLLPNLRLLRILEVEIVFTYCFRNRTLVQRIIEDGSVPAEPKQT
jgi:hypothetical protein